MTNSSFQNALLVCLVQAGSAFFCVSATAQNTSELGIGIGATNYRGEISPEYQLKNNRPAFTVFYRKDVSVPITLRGGFTAGFLRADDGNVEGENGGVSPLQSYRQANTKGGVLEASAVMEYNFLDYHYRTDKVHFTPYLFAGIAAFYANTTTATNNSALTSTFNRDGSMLGFSIPAGVGIKYALSEHINLGLEAGVRKAFSDQIDHLGDQDPLLVNPHDQDWYYYSGVSLSYTFYKIHCPDQYKKNKDLLK
jgi:opacity protein-like surface antigen